MFSDLDQAFTALRERAPRPPFEPAAAVRRRGRRRTHRHIVVAAAAVVGLAVGTGALVARPQATGPAEQRPAGTPTRSPAVERDVPNGRMLQPDDVPAGFRVGTDRDGEGGLPVSIACVNLNLSFERERASRWIVFAGEEAMRKKLWLHDQQIQQTVLVYDAGGAARALSDFGRWIDSCAAPAGTAFEVLARDLGGDESVLYRVTPPAPEVPYYLAFVRTGDRLATLRVGNAFQAATARTLTVTAAARLGS